MSLIVAQHVDAEHTVLEQRGDYRAQMVNTHEQGRLRCIGGHGHHGGYRDSMAPRNAVGGDDIDGAGGVTHPVQELLPQGPFRRRCPRFSWRTAHAQLVLLGKR